MVFYDFLKMFPTPAGGRGWRPFVSILGALWFGLAGAVSAAERPVPGSEPVPLVASESPDFLKPEAPPSFPVTRIILTLALLMGALYFVRPLLKKTKWGGAPTGGAGLDVISRVYLGPKAGLCLVKAEGRTLLVGVGGEGVRLLADLGTTPSQGHPRD